MDLLSNTAILNPTNWKNPPKRGQHCLFIRGNTSRYSGCVPQLFLSFPDSSVAPYMYLFKRSKNATLWRVSHMFRLEMSWKRKKPNTCHANCRTAPTAPSQPLQQSNEVVVCLDTPQVTPMGSMCFVYYSYIYHKETSKCR